jgi:hypothetical protein
MQVFETNAFHAGMDEVFYIGSDQCPRCNGKDKAKLFADEVTVIRDHLAKIIQNYGYGVTVYWMALLRVSVCGNQSNNTRRSRYDSKM